MSEHGQRIRTGMTITDDARLSITRMIAQGGMGTVYEAQLCGVQGFEKTVAVKALLRTMVNEKFTKLFIAEAKLVASLVHENIVQIYQFGRTEGEYYIVMEHVNGISLADFIRHHCKRGIGIPEDLSVYIASRVARGLAYAHKRADPRGMPLNIVHRDVCPNNILITTEGLPKVADFGVAVAQNTANLSEGVVVGKLPYMAPEQAKWTGVDFRADVFSLGAVLFELLTLSRIRRVTREDVETLRLPKRERIPWRLLPANTPVDLIRMLKKMLAHDPAKRYQDTDKLAQALEYYIYKDGYGPTIQTLEKYLRRRFPGLYVGQTFESGCETGVATVVNTEPGTMLSTVETSPMEA